MAEGIPAPQHCLPYEAAELLMHPADPAPCVPGAEGRAGPPDPTSRASGRHQAGEGSRAQPVPLAAGEGTLSLPHGSAPSACSGSPHSPSLSPAQRESGAGARSTAGQLALPTRPPGGGPSLEYSLVLKAAARSSSTPTSPPHACPCPGSHGRGLSSTPNTVTRLWPSSAKPHCSLVLCTVLQGRTSLPLPHTQLLTTRTRVSHHLYMHLHTPVWRQ